MEDGRYYLLGLSSFTRACDTGYPSVSTRIPGLLQWIRDKTGKEIQMIKDIIDRARVAEKSARKD